MKVLPSNLFSVLQLCAVNDASKRFLPNLRSLSLWPAIPELIPFIPSLLSPRITTIDITFKTSDLPKAMVTSMIVTFSILCPNLEFICLEPLPRDPTITAAVSGMLLTSNRNTLRRFHVDSPLTEEAREVIYKLPDLCELSVVIEKDTPLPLVALPNLTELRVTYDHDSDCLHTFHGATFGKLESIHFRPGSEQVGDFLEAFKRVALAASVHKTLLELFLNTSCSWNPNYSSLLPFTQLATLVIGFSCKYGCSSRVDDDIVTDIARAMPRLEKLHLGEPPCRVPTGVTATGLAVLAHHCPDLSSLCIHFQATTLNTQPAVAGIVSYIGTTSLRRNYALMELEVGHISVSKESVPMIALTLFRIFPSLGYIPDDIGGNWEKVIDTIQQIADRSGKDQSSLYLRVALVTPPQEPHPRMANTTTLKLNSM